MKERFFVIGDVHGEFHLLNEILQHWNRQEEQLLFVGDLIDRGEDSRSSILLAKQLVEEYGAIYLKGNHEDMFLKWIHDPEERYGHYQRNGGDTTINSLMGKALDELVDPIQSAHYVRQQYADLIQFLEERPLYLETDHYIFAHAGVDLELSDWHQSTPRDFVWIRNEFHRAKNNTGKKIVFGHTPVSYLTAVPHDPNLWLHDDKIGVDGGAVYGGVLHGVRMDETGVVEDIIVRKEAE